MFNCERRRNKFCTVTFDNSKKRNFEYDDCKMYFRKLTSKGFTTALSNNKISAKSLTKSDVFILFGTSDNLDFKEILLLKKYVEGGGKLLVTGKWSKSSNINLFLNEYGISFRNDLVIRTQRYKNYHHPCEAFISDGIANESLYCMELENCDNANFSILKSFPILYPYGCTLNVKHPSVVLVSSGDYCFPFNRPICAFYRDVLSNGRIVAVGSTSLFLNSYINKEQNLRLLQIFMNFLTKETINLSLADLQSPDIYEYNMVPCIRRLSERPYCCLQETDVITPDFNLLKDKLFQFDNRHFVEVLNAYKELETEYKSLGIIKPKFECPLSSIVPALIPPRFRDLMHPALELMDLDELFMSASLRLDRLTFKCNDDDLEYYIMECRTILDVPRKESAKKVIYFICNEIASLRKYMFI